MPKTNEPAVHLQHEADDESDDFDVEAARKQDRRAAAFSVKKNIENEPKYVVTIAESSDPDAMNPVPLLNGDYSIRVRRGRNVILPEAALVVLRDAVGAKFDDKTKQWTRVQSYPFQFSQYKGDLPIHTEVDDMGKAINQQAQAVPA